MTDLRKQVKLLKALQGISYTEISQYLEISRNGFYNWLKGYYEFSNEREQRLKEILNNIIEG